jgi:jumonji domain-containing protein 7
MPKHVCSAFRVPEFLTNSGAENDNLRDEYHTLFADVPPNISWARIALEQSADAINFWLGNERSVTAMHRDNYENVYVQIIGQKHFVLLPPIEMPCVNEQKLPQCRYAPSSSDTNDSALSIEPQEGQDAVPVAVWDPEEPELRRSDYSHLSKAVAVTLQEGDMLYLPAMWYHKVKQTSGKEGFACAVNYWYDMSFEGSFWAGNSFVRDVALAKGKSVKYPGLDMESEK